jgi:hypothetical protein
MEGASSMNLPPLVVKPARRPGRKRKEGARQPAGRLKGQGPTPELLARRRAIAPDPAMAENPLDAAFSHGWLTENEHRAGRAYAQLFRRAALDAPRLRTTMMGEARSEAAAELAGLRIRDMSDEAVAQLWDLAFSEQAGLGETERARQAAEALAKWRRVNADLTAAERGELFGVCVMESWPQWFCQRLAGEALRRGAEAEKRALSDAELAHIARRFSSPWERGRDALVAGLAKVAESLKSVARKGSPTPARMERRRPAKLGPKVLEEADYVSPEGELLFKVEKRGRR